MFNPKKTVSLLLIMAGALEVLPQQGGLDQLSKQFDSHQKNALTEKIYVHTDKSLYLAGEIMWFKVYAVNGYFHQPLDLSKVAYIELLDMNNNPILQAKIKLEKGTGNGSIFVPVTINSGNYKFRAYSNWMKNFGPDYFFQKQVTIINSQKASIIPAKLIAPSYDVHFFPEGGNLVRGLQSRVAFSITNQSGTGVDGEGIIINDRKDTVARFRTLKFGKGHFLLNPAATQSYTAIINLPGGAKITKELPRIYTSGYVMALDATDSKTIRITVRSSDVPSAMVYLFVHTRNAVKVAQGASIQNGSAVFTIAKAQLGEGISHFTVFNADKKPVCERLFFKYPTHKLNVALRTDAPSYSTRQKINLQLSTADQEDKPLEADLSIAVYRIDSLQLTTEENISEYLWLGSDLSGTIESPGYYFNSSNTELVEAMDHLMLTNGWRRFNWEDALQDRKPLFRYTPELNGHIITGKIVSNKPGGNVSNIRSFLSAPGTNTIFRTSVSDEKGRVRFEMKNFYGSESVIVQTTPEGNETTHIQIDNPFSGEHDSRPVPPFTIPARNPLTLLDRSIGVQVENIYQGDVRRQLIPVTDTTTFYYRPNETYLLDNYVRFTTMEEVLREYVLAVSVRRRDGKFHLPVFNDGARFSEFFPNDPLILLDGVPLFDIDKLMRYDPLKVRKLEAVTREYFYGNMAFDGIVNVVTYKGNLEDFELDPAATVIDYEALQMEREFYSPAYETPEQVNSRLPDFRNVLSWSPNIKTGKAGSYQTSFYSSDLPGKYVMVVQGLTSSGKAGSGMAYFEVK